MGKSRTVGFVKWDQGKNNRLTGQYPVTGRARWYMPAVPATPEAEVGGWLEPRRSRRQCAMTASLHSRLGAFISIILFNPNNKADKYHYLYFTEEEMRLSEVK